ncbi:MAG: flavin reductase [Chloroflexi bacterium]|nr:flavin reductase [Chloroflexota bacterium]
MTPESGVVNDVRKAMRSITYGLYVLTTAVDGEVHAATVSWVTQASFRPRLLAAGLKRDTRIYDAVKQAGKFCINVVGEGQEEMASAFFKFVEADTEAQTVGGYGYRLSEAGVPILRDAAAWIECKVVEEACQTGDHALVIGEVVAGGVSPDRKPLALRDTPWSYGG